MLFERTFEELISESLNELGQTSRINRLSAGAKARSFLEISNRKTNQAYQIFDLNLARAFVSGANGRFLEFIGDLVGVQRLGSVVASSTAEAKSVRFFVETGTFGDINSSGNILLPAGAIVSSEDGGGVRYRLSVSHLLLSTDSESFVAVEALVPGASSNVGRNILTFHNFTGYTDVLEDTLLVTNPAGVFTGKDIESDTNYKFRITRAVTAAESANRIAIRLAALSVPGVADIVEIPFARGIGTYDILIKSITPTVGDALIESTQTSIDAVTALGIVGLARKPIETGISFEITVRFRERLSIPQEDQIKDAIRDNLINYVNNLDIGEEFIINEAVQRVLEADERIKDIGVPTKPFDEITIHLNSKLEDNKIKQSLLTNFLTKTNERVIIEPSLTQPIVINSTL